MLRRNSIPLASAAMLAAVAFSFGACQDDPPPFNGVPSTGGMLVGDEIRCVQPTSGFNRLSEEGAQRGLDLDIEIDEDPASCFVVPGSVVAQDLDGDGDDDLLLFRTQGFPYLFANDGAGYFEAMPEGANLLEDTGRRVSSHAAVDLDGDSLPEVFVVGPGFVGMFPNLGNLEFGPFEMVYRQEAYPFTCFNTMAFGDVDGDGDLDLALPGLDVLPEGGLGSGAEQPDSGSYDLLFLNERGSFTLSLELSPGETPGLSLLGAFTDRDSDGDLDLLVTTDRPIAPLPPTAFYRNDGPDAQGTPILENDAPQIGVDIRFSAMGLAVSDLNGDGIIDYCMSDDYIYCLVSDGMGGYVESGLAMGLVPDLESHPEWDPENQQHNHGDDDDDGQGGNGGEGRGGGGGGEGEGEMFCQWFGWSLELVDFDNDGYLDLPVVSGSTPPRDPSSPAYCDCSFQPDAIWQGNADGTFTERSTEVGFNQTEDHYGMAAADFNGDGARDLIVVPDEGRPKLWMNQCSAGAWIEVELRGPVSNAEGYGARVEVRVGDNTRIREMHSLRSVGQGPSRLHFGLGNVETIDEVRVIWPDGSLTYASKVPVRRTLTFLHQDAP
jgi:enediyne biosynthesis protein E4